MGAHSHSEVETRQKCHRMWYYRYGLKIEGLSTAKPLRLGTQGHYGLKTYFTALQNDASHQEASALMRETVNNLFKRYPEQFADVTATVLTAYDFFIQLNPFQGWKILGVEQEFELPINDTIRVPVTVDLVAQDRVGKIWVIDNKFKYNFPEGIEEEILPQLPLYTAVCRVNGINVQRAGYAYFRTRHINNPTPEQMFKFSEIPLSDTRVLRTFEEHALLALKCQEDKQKPIEELAFEATRIKVPEVCKYCDFQQLCLAELNDRQPKQVMKAFYRPRSKKEELV